MSGDVQTVFQRGFNEYYRQHNPSSVQLRAAFSIINCKTGNLGRNVSVCGDCGHTVIHNNSCRNRHCPSCQAIPREVWIDSRKAEVIDGPYFHVVMTVPSQLNPIIQRNAKLLYPLLHKCSAEALLQLCANPDIMGGVPGIIQILHTWGQTLNYHPHVHCIVSGVGLSPIGQLAKCNESYLLPLPKLMPLFRGKLLHHIRELYSAGKLSLPTQYQQPASWNSLVSALYAIDWAPYIKDTFNGNGNAIEYLGRYTHRIAISNSRIKDVTDTHVTFSAKDYKTGNTMEITVTLVEFIFRFLQHVLPAGCHKIRYYGFLNNRYKRRNLITISQLQNAELRHAFLANLNMAERLKNLWNIDISICPNCGSDKLHQLNKPLKKSG